MPPTADVPVRDPWAVPAARELLPPDAPEDLWLAERRKGIGGSDASTLLGFNRYGSALELWLDKTGRPMVDIDTEAMARGRWLEPVIRERFARDQSMEVRPAGLYQSLAHPLLLCTPDGLTGDGAGLEIKTTTGWLKGDWSDGQVSDHAELQAQHAMAVTGRDYWWVAVSIDGWLPRIRRVDRDQRIIDTIIAVAERWWADYVLTDTPPPLTGGAAENEAMRDWQDTVDPDKTVVMTDELAGLLRRLDAAKQTARDAEAEVVTLDTRVRALIGDAETVIAPPDPDQPKPVVLATCKANGTFSTKRFTAAEPELAAEFTGARTVTALDQPALRLAHPKVHTRFRARVIRTTTAFDDFPKGA